MAIKKLKEIMSDTNKLLRGKNFPIVFLDTSAIIDVCCSAREEELAQRKRKNLPLNEIYADHFLMDIASKYQTVVSPLVNSETKKHYFVRCNNHVMELCKEISPLMEKFSKDYGRLEKSFLNKIPDDTERYDAYWTTKLCCNDDQKKQLEGFSEVDKELITKVTLFSKYLVIDDQKVDPVVVFSSDEHIIKGVKMLNSLDYSNITTIFTRK